MSDRVVVEDWDDTFDKRALPGQWSTARKMGYVTVALREERRKARLDAFRAHLKAESEQTDEYCYVKQRTITLNATRPTQQNKYSLITQPTLTLNVNEMEQHQNHGDEMDQESTDSNPSTCLSVLNQFAFKR